MQLLTVQTFHLTVNSNEAQNNGVTSPVQIEILFIVIVKNMLTFLSFLNCHTVKLFLYTVL